MPQADAGRLDPAAATPGEGETEAPAARDGVRHRPGVDPNAVPPWANRPRH